MMGVVREEHATLLKRILHSWISPLIRAGRARALSLDDLHPLPPPEDTLERNSENFRNAFQGSLLPALLKTFKRRFATLACLLIVVTGLGLLRPLLLRELIGRFTTQDQKGYENFFAFIHSDSSLAAFAIGCFAVLALVRSHLLRHSFKMTWAMPGLLRHEVFRKLLELTPEQRTHLTTGEYVNIATRDCDTTSTIAFLLEPLLYPLTLTVYCLMLVYFLGPWALLAVMSMIVIVPLGRRLERRMSSLATNIREQSRIRLGILSEILTGIRVIKFHAWEDKFADRVMNIRDKEIKLMKERARVAARHSALTALLPILTGALVVTLVSWLSEVPSTADVFASFSVIASMVTIFSETPDVLQTITELRVSLKRIGDFLSQPRSQPQSHGEAHTKNTQPIALQLANYSRPRVKSDEPVVSALHDISLTIQPGQCVAVVGSVGSGKSTLLHALLGELSLASGVHHLPHPVAYAPQIPWNQNATVKDNIVFQMDWNPEIFDKVVSASALRNDLRDWAGGAECEVGERGINLSGGQKQRLALARTLYAALCQNVDTIIWDDPFSALDEGVANHIFTTAIEHVLSGRTRIFATHRIDFALRADHVVVMDKGRIVEQGKPQLLLSNSGGHFTAIVELHQRTRGQQVLSEVAAHEDECVDSAPLSEPGKLMTEEKVALPMFNKEGLTLYLRTLAPALGFIGVSFVFLLPKLTDVASNLWLGHWTSHSESVAITQAMIVFALLTFATVVMERARALILFDGGVRAGSTFFKNLVDGVFKAPLRFFDTSPQGRILNRFTSDTTTIDSSMPSSVGQFLTSFAGVFASLLPIVWAQPRAVYFIAPAAVCYIWLFRTVRGAQLRLNALSQTVRSPWMSLTAETLPGLSVIRSLQAEERFISRYRSLINRHISTGFYVVAVNLWFAFRLELLGVALVGGFIVALTLWQSEMSTTFAAVGLTFSLQLVGILGGIARSIRFLENALVSVDRVTEYTHISPESTPNPVTVPESWPARGEIEFTNLCATYAPNLPPVLSELTYIIPACHKIGIIGRTGSGKSTLFLALTRMIPLEKGMIFIDGVDISTVPLSRLRRSISMIPQDPVLFSGTLRDNLDPFGLHDDTSINTALRRAHLDHLCRSAGEATHFKIEENGRNLSVGERQLVCLARALLNRCKILLIDEATANVDVATDAKIQQTLREEFTDCTRLVIAHRTHTLSDVHTLMKLENGRLSVGQM